MAIIKHVISEHDLVALREAAGSWPAGTPGVAVSVYDDRVLVEISDLDGKVLDLVQVGVGQLDVRRA